MEDSNSKAKRKSSKRSHHRNKDKITSKKEGFSIPYINPEEITLKAQLGKGCFGKVYVGECRSMEVAVKIPKKQTLSKRAHRAFTKEVEIMSKNYHPNVCLFMGACIEPGNIRIVSEKLDIDLEKKIHRKKRDKPREFMEDISLTQRMMWAKEACKGVAWLHGSQPPIIHRDLKPANMLLDEHSRVKVCDFGLSHFMEKGMYDKTLRGTPLYMAPEVMKNEEITEKVDVYSMGIIIWELLKREEPFLNHSDQDVFIEAICIQKERPPIPENCPPKLRALLNRCWDENPDVRPSMEEIVSLIDDLMDEIAEYDFTNVVDAAIKDTVGRAFWKRNFPVQTSVDWKTFISALYKDLKLKLPKDPSTSVLPITSSKTELQRASIAQLMEFSKLSKTTQELALEEIKRREGGNFSRAYRSYGESVVDNVTDELKDIYCLNALLADNDSDTVSLEDFGSLLGWLGPLEIPSKAELGFIDRVVELVTQPYFHGAVSTPHAENILRPQEGGVFLVRFSNTKPDCLAISKVSMNKVIKHIIIKNEPGKGFELDGTHYQSVPDLIQVNREKYSLFTSCPGSKFLWLCNSESNATVEGYGVTDD